MHLDVTDCGATSFAQLPAIDNSEVAIDDLSEQAVRIINEVRATGTVRGTDSARNRKFLLNDSVEII